MMFSCFQVVRADLDIPVYLDSLADRGRGANRVHRDHKVFPVS